MMPQKKKNSNIKAPPILAAPPKALYLEFTKEDMETLASRDAKLGAAMAAIGPLRRRLVPEPFTGLLYTVLSQQISSRARDAIWQKLLNTHAPMPAAAFARLQVEELRLLGISARKAQTMLNIAANFASGFLNAASLAQMGDYSLIRHLTALPGIGRWTAEMLLIFTFGRPNVLSTADLGIRRGACALYGWNAFARGKEDDLARRFSPLGTLASFYLWEIAARCPLQKHEAKA